MPRTRALGDSVEYWRMQFLREVARHVPAVLADLRDSVFSTSGVVRHYRDLSPPEDPEAGASKHGRGRRALMLALPTERDHAALVEWRNRHHLNTSDQDQDTDWIAERTLRTLEDWSRRPPDSLYGRREWITRLEKELRSSREKWHGIHHRLLVQYPSATGPWLWAALQAPDHCDSLCVHVDPRLHPALRTPANGALCVLANKRAAARTNMRRCLSRLRRARRLPTDHVSHLRWWSPSRTKPQRERLPQLDLRELAKEWTPERNARVEAKLHELSQAVRVWKDAAPKLGPAKEVTHFRWLALWQCAGFSHADVAKHEKGWTDETIQQLLIVLEDGEKSASDQRVDALRILYARGEPWIPGEEEGAWPLVWAASPRGAVAWLKKNAKKVKAPEKSPLAISIKETAELIGLRRRPGGRGGRRRNVPNA